MSVALVTYPPARVFAKNPISYQVQSTGYAGLANYRVVLRIHFEKVFESGTFEQLAEIEDIPDGDGFTTWNVQAIIDAALEENTILQVPAINSTVAYIADNRRRFYIEYAERYGQPATTQAFTASDTSTAYHGGIDMQVFPDLDYLATRDTSNNIFSWMPDGQKVAVNQPAYIAFFNNNTPPAEQFLRWRAYNALGVQVETGIDTLGFSVQEGETVVIPCGYTQLGISNDTTKKYTIELSVDEVGDTPIHSGIITFYVDQKPAHCERSLLWFNSFNMPETLRLTGRTSTSLEVDRQEFIRTLPYGYNVLDGELLQHSADWFNTSTYRTGYLRKTEVDALQDMLIKNILFEIADESYYRMHLTGKKYQITECLQFLHSLELEAVRSLKPINFSRLAIPATQGYWELSSDGYYQTATGGRYELAQ